MDDVLIRNVPEEVLAVIDHRAGHLGLSRSEYLHRLLRQEAGRSDSQVSAADLQRLSQTARQLSDTEVMDQAWS